MKKPLSLSFLTVIIAILLLSTSFGQSTKYGWLAKQSWAFGFGGTYPQYMSTDLGSFETYQNYGGYLSIQKNFSEHVGLRLKASYLAMEAGLNRTTPIENHVIAGDLNLLYYFVPCEPVSPYLGVGLGLMYYTPESDPAIIYTDDQTTGEAKGYLDYQMSLLFGAEWRVGENWKLKTEIGYYSTNVAKFDGSAGTRSGGILGNNFDSYMSFDLGLLVYFGYGEKSNICDLYEGLARVDYDRIEEIVRRHQTPATEVDYNRIEDIVKKHRSTGAAVTDDNWVLVGVNFDFDKATLRPEAYPVMYHAAQVLLSNPDVRVEIQGHTDHIGSEGYNQKLSERRAETVKQWLVAKGVAANRLTTVGHGETKPITDGKTPQARELNRRVEFKVLNK